MESFFYILLAIFGLGFLVFIHELGHFWVARREGMRVEAFSVGMGKPLYTWTHRGVKWMICCLPFGGYVRIAGMQREGNKEPEKVSDGFYGKTPWQRIKVAIAGPFVNIMFSLLAFTAVWVVGGRLKPSSDFTHRIGWVDPQSSLYQLGLRPGDVIEQCEGKPFQGFKDLLIASLIEGKETIQIDGFKVDAKTGSKTSFSYPLKIEGALPILPASYLIYDEKSSFATAGTPAATSGMTSGDRIIWADGERIFSVQQLSALMNGSAVLLTVQRGDSIFSAKVPRVQLNTLKMTPSEKAEIGDWQYDAKLKAKLQDLYFIPFTISPKGVVESPLDFLEPKEEKLLLALGQGGSFALPLEEGDRILSLDGIPFQTTHQFLEALQKRRFLMIVARGHSFVNPIQWREVNDHFEDFSPSSLRELVGLIGMSSEIQPREGLHLLTPMTPRAKNELPMTPEQRSLLSHEMSSVKKQIESMKDPSKRSEAMRQFEAAKKRLALGIPLRDREVTYNPNPLVEFKTVIEDTWRTLRGLFSGHLNPKYMSGPVGIIQVVHQSWMIGVKEALFWMAVISLNLGIVNLLPIPVLDGGHIVFSFLEIVRRRPIAPKTMERITIPFVGLLILFFIYITYQDVIRLLFKIF